MLIPPQIKSAATEVTAQKTQTPIVAKLTQCEMGRKRTHIHIGWNLHFYQIHPYMNIAEKSVIIPKKKKHTRFHTY